MEQKENVFETSDEYKKQKRLRMNVNDANDMQVHGKFDKFNCLTNEACKRNLFRIKYSVYFLFPRGTPFNSASNSKHLIRFEPIWSQLKILKRS